jgi:hypothetical protein
MSGRRAFTTIRAVDLDTVRLLITVLTIALQGVAVTYLLRHRRDQSASAVVAIALQSTALVGWLVVVGLFIAD